MKFNITADFLTEQYVNQKHTPAQIAKLLGCSHMAVYRRLKKLGFSLRSASDYRRGLKFSDSWKENLSLSQIGQARPLQRGPLNSQWKGGITPLSHLIRISAEGQNWTKSVFIRDSYRCQCCGSTNDLNAHHIEPFSEILKNFLKQYHMFSPIEDKETLLWLAIYHSEFWKLENGQTLCVDCHKEVHRLKVAK